MKNAPNQHQVGGMRRQFRILQITNTLARSDGGPARNAYELHKALNDQADVKATLVTIKRTPGDQTVYGEEPTAIKGGQLLSTVTIKNLWRSLQSSDAVVIHGYYLAWAPLIGVLARANGTKVFVTPHGSLTEYQQQKSKRKKLVFDLTAGLILRSAVHRFIVGSKRERDELRAKFPRMPVSVAGVGAPFPAEVPTWQPDSTLRLLSISRIAPKKRMDLIIKTAGELKLRSHQVRLTIAGTGAASLILELNDIVRHDGLSAEVTFVGEADDDRKRQLYADADIFIAPSDDENFGISVAEALSHGVPCVTSTKVASAINLHAPAGLQVDQRTPSRLADAVCTLMTARTEGQVAARIFAKDAYSWEAVATRWVTALQS